MAVFALTGQNCQVLLNSVDLTSRIDSITLKETFGAIETTALGATAKSFIGGLGEHKLDIEFQQDYAAAEVDATITPLLNTVVPIVVRSLVNTTATTNPVWTFSALINDYTPIAGKVGELVKSAVTWPVSGAVTEVL